MTTRRTLTRAVTLDDCLEFYDHPQRNPLTQRSIEIHGPTYRRLILDCDSILNRIRPPIDYLGVPRSIQWIARYLYEQPMNTDMYRDIRQLATEQYGEPFVTRFVSAREQGIPIPSLIPFLQQVIHTTPAVARRVAETVAIAARLPIHDVPAMPAATPTVAPTVATPAAMPAATPAAMPAAMPTVAPRVSRSRTQTIFAPLISIHTHLVRWMGYSVELPTHSFLSENILRKELVPSICGTLLYKASIGEPIILNKTRILPTHPQYRAIIDRAANIMLQSPAHRRIALNFYLTEMEKQHPTRYDQPTSSLVPISKKTLSTPSENTSINIPMVCEEMFVNITYVPYQRWVRKMKKMCMQMKETICSQKDLEQLQFILQKSLVEKPIDYGYAMHFISLENPLQYIWNIQPRIEQERRVFFWRMKQFQHYRFRFAEQEGVGSGVFRTVLMSIMENILRDGFFVATEDGSGRMIVNDHLTLTHLRSLGYRIRDEEDLCNLYRFLGEFCAFCVCHQIPVQIYFAFGVLAQILYTPNELKMEDYTFYSLLDWPQMSRSILNLMKDPSTIEYASMEFNDQFPLLAENKEIDSENIIEFIGLKAKYQYTVKSTVSGTSISARTEAFCKGFYIRNQLRKAKVNVWELDKLISGFGITLENIDTWIQSNRIIVSNTDPTNHKIEKWFREILHDEGRTFPMDMVDDSMPRDERFLDFIGRLMFFWTSLRKLDFQKQYSLEFHDLPLPTASTCFYILRLPKQVKKKEELYRIIVNAVYNVELGVGLYGGYS